MKILLVRHGESVDDIEDCYGGIADFPLTDLGRQQALEAVETIRAYAPEAIYTSPLLRAREASEIIAASLGLQGVLQVVETLQERNTYGILSGVNKQRAQDLFAHVLHDGEWHEDLPGVETAAALRVRARDAFDATVADAGSKGYNTIMITTHGKFMTCLWEEVLGLEGKPDTGFCAINPIEYRPATSRSLA